MQKTAQNPDQIQQAVFSVCASGDVVSAAILAVTNTPGSEFVGEFHAYITMDRRPQFSAQLKTAAACVAIVDCDLDPELALETMERLQSAAPRRLNLIGVATQPDADLLLKSMRSGCNDFLSKPFQHEQLIAALTRFQTMHESTNQAPQSFGKVVSLFGAKNGVGTTTLAVHLAVNLVRRHARKVLLIDHKHELGHVSLHLGLQDGIYFFNELVQNVDRLDADLLEGFVSHHPSGLEVIASPDHAAPLHDIPPGVTERVMDYLRTRYDFILLDSSVVYSNTLASLVVASDEICLVCTPDIAALRDLVRHTEHLSHMKGFPAKLRVIINRSTAADAVNAEQIATAIKFPVSMAIPNSYLELVRAVNAGEPVSPQDKGPFSQAIDRWAHSLTADAPAEIAAPTFRQRLIFWRQSA